MAWSDWASAIGSGVGSLFSGLFGNSQQKKQNKFAAEQAELDRQFQAEQAELANQFTTSERLASQQWEEDWYNNYSSPQAMVRQYEEAGLNPALMYGQAGSSTGDTPSAPSGESGAYASGSKATPLQGLSALDYLQFAVDSFDRIVGAFGRIEQNKHQRQINDWYDQEMDVALEERRSNILLNQARETGVYEDVLNSRVARDYTKAQIKHLAIQGDWYRAQIDKIKSDIGLNDANISKIGAEMALCVQQFKQREGLYPWELMSKKLDVDEKETKKAFMWLVPQMFREFEDSHKESVQRVVNLIKSGKLTDAEIDKVKDEDWYQKWNNEFTRITGHKLDSDIFHLFGTDIAWLIGNPRRNDKNLVK